MAPDRLEELGAALRDGSTSVRELTGRSLARARAAADLNAFLSLDDEGALATAARLDRELEGGRDRGPLHGIPIAVKDNLCAAGLPTTCGSRLLEGFVPAWDATAVARLRDAGAVVIGKTNLDEFGMGSSNENSAYGPVRNPLDPGRVAGGSSGGSAAAVAAGVVPLALGTDTGGSVRQPAALCGVVGLKPGWGRVSRYGLVAFGSSLDQIGPIAADVAGVAAALRAMAGVDPRDSTSDAAPVEDYLDGLDAPVRVRVGVPRQYVEGLDAGARSALEAALERPGVERVEVELPHTEFALAAYYVLASAEASSNLARFDGIRYGRRAARPDAALEEVYVSSRTGGLGPEVRRRILLGTFALSAGYQEAYYGRALAARRAVAADFDAAFAEVDLVAGPTSPTTAWPLGERIDDPVRMYLSDAFTIPASLAGLPAISIPAGRDPSGLPRGLQLVGPSRSEAALLRAARLVEGAS